MKIHHLTPDEALASLHSGPRGLAAAEARRRLREFGRNEVQHVRRQPAWLTLLKEFTHFFAIILWVAAALAFWAGSRDPVGGMAALGWAILGVIVINGLFSFWQVHKAEAALAELEKLLPHRVKTLRGGEFLDLAADELVPGDVVSLTAGDLVPADCRLIEAFAVRVNTATVTGESQPQSRNAEPCTEDDALHSRNILLAGTSLVAGDAQAIVYATGMHTEFGRIAHLVQSAGVETFPLQREIAFLSRVVAALALTLGILFFLIGFTRGLTFWQTFLFAVGILVANVPEGLLPTVTLALAMGAQRMARRNVLIRRLPAVETLGSATVICTDKTGTLTENRMHVESVYLNGELRGASAGWDPAAIAAGERRFLECLALCHNLKQSANAMGTCWLGDPTEVALVEFASPTIGATADWTRIDEVPFDSDRKRFSTLHKTPVGNVLYSKGALETVLPLCHQVQTTDGVIPLDSDWRDRLLKTQEQLADSGLRVLAVAWREVVHEVPRGQLENQLVLAGLVALEDPPRPEVPAAVETCRAAGIRVIMVTGDHPHTALGIARQIGLVRSEHPVVITGDRLRRMPDSQLQLLLDAPEIIFARVAANQKLRIVEILQRKGEVVAVTGDGVNDAPALKQADIGIAMGVTGTDVARESADMVLTDDNFASIVLAVQEGRAVYDNVRKFLTYILTSNIPEIVPYLAFVLLRIPLPLTIMQILAIDLGTDMVPALALGAESPDPDVMRRPPRARTERLLTWPLLARAYLFLGILEAVAGMSAFFFVLLSAGWQYGQPIDPGSVLETTYRQATTACLAAIVVMQIVNVFLCRSETKSVFQRGLFRNRLILAGIAVELALLAVISDTPVGDALFETAPLAAPAWGFILPFAGAMFILEEARKCIVRRSSRGVQPLR
jgi:calcium-translocating P-type ATPase